MAEVKAKNGLRAKEKIEDFFITVFVCIIVATVIAQVYTTFLDPKGNAGKLAGIIIGIAAAITNAIFETFLDYSIPTDPRAFAPLLARIGWLIIISVTAILLLMRYRREVLNILIRLLKLIPRLFKLILSNRVHSIPADGKMFFERVTHCETGDSFSAGLPPLSILGEVKNSSAKIDNALEKRINRVFQDLDLKIKVKKYIIGATITNVWLELLDNSVRIKIVTNLKDDIAMMLHVEAVNIITTQDGLIMEVPNKERRLVTHREVMEKLKKQKWNELSIAVGEKSTGEPFLFDLNDCPHLLIAGATKMGKSVCLNTIIATLLTRKKPSELQFLLIDPKLVEFFFFEELKHLARPVITGVDGGIEALNWCVGEMERRYKILTDFKVRELYKIPKEKRPFPVLIIIIDEVADLMMAAGNEVDSCVARLAGKARAAGMHLILATQRPDAKVLSGLIRSNILGRIALKTNNATDSGIILDQPGAETLTGKGEMIVKVPGMKSAVRCQGSFIDDADMEKLVEWWKTNHKGEGTTTTKESTFQQEGGEDNKEVNQKGNDIIDEQESEELEETPEMILRRSICDGVLEADEDEEIKLPTVREITDLFGITMWQTRQILDKLKEESWIEKVGETKTAKTIIVLDKKAAAEWLKINGYQIAHVDL